MQHNNNSVPRAFVDIQPVSHDMNKLKVMLKGKNDGELAILQACNSLAKETPYVLKKARRKWNTFKALAIYASLVPLLITLLIYYISPMFTQSEFAFNDARVWGMGALMASVAFAVAILIDLGRANILDKSNSTGIAYALYFFMSTASIIFSTTGMIAVADFYASSEATDTKDVIATAKAHMVANAGLEGKNTADIDAKIIELTKLRHTKKSGYHPADLRRDVARLNEERKAINDYQSAKATVAGKRALQNTDDSSNWLFNTYARILESSTATAGLVIGLAMNFLAEAMALIAHMRLIKLNARIEVTEQQWNNATMVANEAMIVADSTLSSLNHIDYFAHTFRMPFNILSEYQNQGKRYGEFIEEAEVINDKAPVPTLGQKQPSVTGDKQNKARERYMIASNANKGDKVECPACIELFTKKAHNSIFCKNKGKGNCKDEYHNLMNPARIGARK